MGPRPAAGCDHRLGPGRGQTPSARVRLRYPSHQAGRSARAGRSAPGRALSYPPLARRSAVLGVLHVGGRGWLVLDYADLSVRFEVSTLYLGQLVDPLFAQLSHELVGRYELPP